MSHDEAGPKSGAGFDRIAAGLRCGYLLNRWS